MCLKSTDMFGCFTCMTSSLYTEMSVNDDTITLIQPTDNMDMGERKLCKFITKEQ